MCVYTTMNSRELENTFQYIQFSCFLEIASLELLSYNIVLESYHNSKAFLLEKHGEVKDPHIFCPISYYFPVLEGNKMWRQPEFLLCLSFLFSYISRRIMAFLTHNDMRPSLLTSQEQRNENEESRLPWFILPSCKLYTGIDMQTFSFNPDNKTLT